MRHVGGVLASVLLVTPVTAWAKDDTSDNRSESSPDAIIVTARHRVEDAQAVARNGRW